MLFPFSKKAFSLVTLVNVLFMVVFLLQIGDLHSTLTANQNQAETNKMILFFAQYLSLTGAVILIKLGDMAAIGILFYVWKKCRGMHAIEFVLSLLVICTVYAFVVLNNYLR